LKELERERVFRAELERRLQDVYSENQSYHLHLVAMQQEYRRYVTVGIRLIQPSWYYQLHGRTSRCVCDYSNNGVMKSHMSKDIRVIHRMEEVVRSLLQYKGRLERAQDERKNMVIKYEV
jgi:hypothetical protein